MGRLAVVIVALAAGCGFAPVAGQADAGQPPPGIDAPRSIDARDARPPIDGPPTITCGQLACDPHATCTMTAAGATCTCNTGYDGDGMTCTAIDPCATNNGGCDAVCVTTGPGSRSCVAPRTCADVAMYMTPPPDDTDVTLYFQGDADKPWTAFCHQGHEYLTLPAGASANYGQYTAGGASAGSNVRTTYSKVRIDPMAAKLDISDQAFATSTGMLTHSDSGIHVTSMPLGVAMDCRGNNSSQGAAGIDLTGTPFTVTSGWSLQGSHANGSTNQNGKRIELTGGGYCGWNAPDGAPQNPFNTLPDGKLVDVAYP